MGNTEDKEDAVEAYLEDRIDFDELAEKVGTENAEAVRSSKDVLKEGSKIAERIADIG